MSLIPIFKQAFWLPLWMQARVSRRFDESGPGHIVFGHQNRIGETKSGKTNDRDEDEKNLAEGERLNAD